MRSTICFVSKESGDNWFSLFAGVFCLQTTSLCLFKDNSTETPMKSLSVQMLLPGKELLKSTSEMQVMGELVEISVFSSILFVIQLGL